MCLCFIPENEVNDDDGPFPITLQESHACVLLSLPMQYPAIRVALYSCLRPPAWVCSIPEKLLDSGVVELNGRVCLHLFLSAQEGAAIVAFKLVTGGMFDEQGVSDLLHAPGKRGDPACSGTRNLEDNLSDLRAQARRNIVLLRLKLPNESIIAHPENLQGIY